MCSPSERKQSSKLFQKINIMAIASKKRVIQPGLLLAKATFSIANFLSDFCLVILESTKVHETHLVIIWTLQALSLFLDLYWSKKNFALYRK